MTLREGNYLNLFHLPVGVMQPSSDSVKTTVGVCVVSLYVLLLCMFCEAAQAWPPTRSLFKPLIKARYVCSYYVYITMVPAWLSMSLVIGQYIESFAWFRSLTCFWLTQNLIFLWN